MKGFLKRMQDFVQQDGDSETQRRFAQLAIKYINAPATANGSA
jgi:hypothetical protein